MPNWTSNSINITGSKDAIKKFKADAIKHEGGILLLSSWMPIPETFLKYDTTNHPYGKGLKVGNKWWDGLGHHGDEIITEELIEEFKRATEEQKEKYGVIGWYDYNLKTFGCKWDCRVEISNESDEQIDLSTETPWYAPHNWLLTPSKNYPEISFYLNAYYEDGFWEETKYHDGAKAILASGEYNEDEEEEEA